MARSTPRVAGGALVGLHDAASAIVVGTPAWYAWLDGATMFAFTSPHGGFTARKERSGQTGWYWKAYRKRGGTLQRAYLGKSADLSLDRLTAIATELAQRPAGQSPAESPVAASVARAVPDAEAPPMSAASLPTGTVTFLFTDIEGSTQLWEQQKDSMPAALARHDAILRQAIAAHGGVVFKTVGDGCHAVFARAPDALAATLAAQRTLHAEAWDTAGPLRVRMALHTGAAEARDGDYYGSPLNRVARILALGHGGQILLSRATHDLVVDDLPAQASLRDLGEHTLKDLSRPEQIFQLLSPDLPIDFPPLRPVDPRRAPTPAQPLPLLATKLYVPLPRANLVPRARLVERLQAGLTGKLTLIAAPAGFGKTTLVSAWRTTPAGSAMPVAWVSLDAGDNDVPRFWSYVIAALETIYPEVGTAALALLRSPQPPPMESILTPLLNAISATPTAMALVLDDYHQIDTSAIHAALAFLLDHLPPHLHVIMTTRVDPPLPLTRLRARGDLTELRAADLRFTSDEAAAFLTAVMDLPLTSDEVAALEARTEGWVAGLQFAALAMRDRTDLASFIAAFTGSNRFVVDYLAEEVLDRLPHHLQTFVLQTSILDRLCGPLCDAVILSAAPETHVPPPSAQGSYSQALLEQLEHANVFLMVLDDERRWYRYHHLFAEVVHQRLINGVTAEMVTTLHRRASAWHVQASLIDEAIHHALAARDVERAGVLIEEMAQSWLGRGEVVTLRGWLHALPHTLLLSRPRLCLAYAWVLSFSGKIDAMAAWVHEAERALRCSTADDHGDSSGIETDSLLGEVAALHAMIALSRDDFLRAIDLCQQALSRISQDNVLVRSLITLNLGHAYLHSHNTVAASQVYAAASDLGQAAGHLLLTLQALTNLTTVYWLSGQLREAWRTSWRALQLGTSRDGQYLPVAALPQLWLGWLQYEWNDLDSATRYLTEAIELGRQAGNETITLRASIFLARVRQAQGDANGAHALIQQARQLNHASTSDWVAAIEARLWLADGQIAAAAGWARDARVSPDDEPNEWLEFEHVTLVRVLLAQHKPDAAVRLLDRMLLVAEANTRTGRVIEILILRALALHAQRDVINALIALERALMLAAPESYIRIFVDEGAPMGVLLREAHAHGITPEYVAKLLAAFGKDAGGRMKDEVTSAPVHPSSFIPQPLLEPLTDRELEVLRLMAAGRSNTEIAHALVVAVSTIKTHVNRIFGKLGVTSRTQAVARARELHLL